MTWVVFGHALFIPLTTRTVSNALDVGSKWPLNFMTQVKFLTNYFFLGFFQTIIDGTFSVDSFFFISGALLSYLFVKRNCTWKDLPDRAQIFKILSKTSKV